MSVLAGIDKMSHEQSSGKDNKNVCTFKCVKCTVCIAVLTLQVDPNRKCHDLCISAGLLVVGSRVAFKNDLRYTFVKTKKYIYY